MLILTTIHRDNELWFRGKLLEAIIILPALSPHLVDLYPSGWCELTTQEL